MEKKLWGNYREWTSQVALVVSSVESNSFVTLWIVVQQAFLSIEFSRQEYRSGLPFPSAGDLPNPGTEPESPALQAKSLLSEPSSIELRCQSRYTWETRVWSLEQEDPLEEGVAIHPSILAWRIPWTGEPGMLQSVSPQRVGYNWSDLAHREFPLTMHRDVGVLYLCNLFAKTNHPIWYIILIKMHASFRIP